MSREGGGIETHQHDDAVRNGAHRFQRTDCECTTAVTEAAAFSGKSFLQNADHHANIQLQSTVIGLQLPGVQALMNRLQLPVPVAPVIENVLEQSAQSIHPFAAWNWQTQPGDPSGQLIQQWPPHLQLLQAQIREGGSTAIESQARFLGQCQAKQPSIETPAQAVGVVSIAFRGIKAPSEATALQCLRDRHRIHWGQLFQVLQGRVAEQCLKATGGEPISTQSQQGHESLLQARAVLLTAVGQSPGQVHTGGITV